MSNMKGYTTAGGGVMIMIIYCESETEIREESKMSLTLGMI